MSPNSNPLIPRIGDESAVAHSWERFLLDRPLPGAGVRNVVLDSWRRSRSEAVDPNNRCAPAADENKVRQLRERSRDLYEAAKPVLETLREILRESGTLIMLSDPSGTILDLNGESRARNAGELGPLSAVCGPPFDASSDMDPPTVAISTPTTGSMFDSDPATGQAAFPVQALAEDGTGYGVDTVRLTINGADVPGGTLSSEPYVWNGSYPPGQYTFQVVATDVAGNVAESELVYVGVDMDPPSPPEPTDDSGSGGSGSEGGVDTGIDSDGMDDTTGDGSATGGPVTLGQDEPSPEGCGCRGGQAPAPAAWMLGLLGLLGLRRRRS